MALGAKESLSQPIIWMRNFREIRILAVDARRSRFGYALFEGPTRLLDWGASEIPAYTADRTAVLIASKRIVPLLKLGHPEVLVVKRPRRGKRGSATATAPIVKAILREATERQIRVCPMSRKEILRAFRIFEGSTKNEIAEFLAGVFPELLARLPPKKKAWQSERHSMIVFDAIATGFAFWQRNGAQSLPPE
jgi:hypothetical protein